MVEEAIYEIGFSLDWVKTQLQQRQSTVDEIFLGQVDHLGNLYLDYYKDGLPKKRTMRKLENELSRFLENVYRQHDRIQSSQEHQLKIKDQELQTLESVAEQFEQSHGSSDPGAQGNGLKEKDIVLDIANKIRPILTNNYENVEVKMSRTSDICYTWC